MQAGFRRENGEGDGERERVVVTGELSYYNSKSFSVKAESSIRVIGRETRKPEKYIKIEMEIEK